MTYPHLLCDYIEDKDTLRAVNFTLAMMRDGQSLDTSIRVASAHYRASFREVAIYVYQHLHRRVELLKAQVEARR